MNASQRRKAARAARSMVRTIVKVKTDRGSYRDAVVVIAADARGRVQIEKSWDFGRKRRRAWVPLTHVRGTR